MTLTLDRMRADIAEAIHIPPAELAEDENLVDLGLDSMRLMTLVLKWQEAGLALDFGVFAERATLAEWWEVVRAHQAPAR